MTHRRRARPGLCPGPAKGRGPLETHSFQCHEVQGLGPSREGALGTWWGLGRSPILGFDKSSFTRLGIIKIKWVSKGRRPLVGAGQSPGLGFIYRPIIRMVGIVARRCKGAAPTRPPLLPCWASRLRTSGHVESRTKGAPRACLSGIGNACRAHGPRMSHPQNDRRPRVTPGPSIVWQRLLTDRAPTLPPWGGQRSRPRQTIGAMNNETLDHLLSVG